MEELLNILKQIDAEIDFENEKDLVDTGTLDSIAIVEIIAAIEDKYGLIIDPEDIDPDNFQSLEAISNMVNRMIKKQKVCEK